MEYKLQNELLEVKLQSFGGALSSIRDRNGVEYLWQGDKEYWGGQAPVLFPICGSIRNDEAKTLSGKTLKMPRHGIVRKKEFSCIKQTEQSIAFALDSDAAMFEQYPFPFRLEIEYTLTENEIRTGYRIYNKGTENMPFFIGGHPGFNCPFFPAERYEDYYLEFDREETCDVPTPVTETGLIDVSHRSPFLYEQNRLPLNHSLFERDAVILDKINSKMVKLLSKNHVNGIQLDFADFPYLILWSSANQGPFIALEPWLGLSTCSDESDIFEEKRNIQNVAGGANKEYFFSIRILSEIR